MRSSWIRGLLLITLIAMLTLTAFTASDLAVAQSVISCDPAATAAQTSATPAATPAPVEAVPFPENSGEVTVFAASSLTDAFNAIAADLEAANPGLDLVYNFAGSQALVTQLTEGAHADVFASANNGQMTAAIKAGVISSEPQTFAHNR